MARIVVVDDSLFPAKKIQAFLEGEGHAVSGIGLNGNEAFDLYRKFKPDLITLDIIMPEKSGKESLKDILDFDADARSILDPSVIADCMDIGAKGFIEKPLKFSNPEFCSTFAESINAALH